MRYTYCISFPICLWVIIVHSPIMHATYSMYLYGFIPVTNIYINPFAFRCSFAPYSIAISDWIPYGPPAHDAEISALPYASLNSSHVVGTYGGLITMISNISFIPSYMLVLINYILSLAIPYKSLVALAHCIASPLISVPMQLQPVSKCKLTSA